MVSQHFHASSSSYVYVHVTIHDFSFFPKLTHFFQIIFIVFVIFIVFQASHHFLNHFLTFHIFIMIFHHSHSF